MSPLVIPPPVALALFCAILRFFVVLDGVNVGFHSVPFFILGWRWDAPLYIRWGFRRFCVSGCGFLYIGAVRRSSVGCYSAGFGRGVSLRRSIRVAFDLIRRISDAIDFCLFWFRFLLVCLIVGLGHQGVNFW